MLLNWNSLLSILGVILSFFMAFILLNRPCSRKANYYLAGFLIVLTLSQTYEIIYTTNLYIIAPILIKTNIPVQFLVGPFLYFYISKMIDKSFIFNRRKFLHILPFVIVTIYFIPFFILPADQKINFVRTNILEQAPSNIEVCVIWTLLQISLSVYAIKSIIKIHFYKKNIKNFSSDISETTLLWLRYCLVTAMSFVMFFVVLDIFMLLGYPLVFFNHIISVSMNILLLVLSSRAIIKLEYITIPLTNSSMDQPVSVSEEEKTSLKVLFEKVSSMVKIKEYFLETELSLQDLADYLDLSRTELSRILNQGGQLNFYDFINQQRIIKVQSILSSTKNHDSILTIAFNCGFNSKSAFHTAFKKWTKMTPTQFKNSNI